MKPVETLTGSGQVQRHAAAVSGIGKPRDEAASLQSFENAGERAWVQAEQACHVAGRKDLESPEHP
jgi:hypothetical protein